MSAQTSPAYLRLQPDAYSRYFIIKEILVKLFGKKKIKVLDLGGKETSIWEMFKEEKLPYKLTVLDILPPDEKTKNFEYIQGDATASGFKDNSFDAVISTDVLEHIPLKLKKKFIEEAIRIAKDVIIISAPFDSVDTDNAEHAANNYFKELSGHDHPWLVEHFSAYKPERNQMEQIIKKHKLKHTVIESNFLPNWLITLTLNFLPLKDALTSNHLDNLNFFYNQNYLQMNDFSHPAYRQSYVIFKNSKLYREAGYFIQNQPDFKKISDFYVQIFKQLSEEVHHYKYAHAAALHGKNIAEQRYENEMTHIINLIQQNNHIREAIRAKHQIITEYELKFRTLMGRYWFKGWKVLAHIKWLIFKK